MSTIYYASLREASAATGVPRSTLDRWWQSGALAELTPEAIKAARRAQAPVGRPRVPEYVVSLPDGAEAVVRLSRPARPGDAKAISAAIAKAARGEK